MSRGRSTCQKAINFVFPEIYKKHIRFCITPGLRLPFALVTAAASWEVVDLEVRVEAFDLVDLQLTSFFEHIHAHDELCHRFWKTYLDITYRLFGET